MRKVISRLLSILLIASALSAVVSVPAANADVIASDGSSNAGWTATGWNCIGDGTMCLNSVDGNPAGSFGFTKGSSMYRSYGTSAADFAGTTVKFDIYFTSNLDWLGFMWGANSTQSATVYQLVLGPGNDGSKNGITYDTGSNAYWQSYNPRAAVNASWSLNTWYSVKLVLTNTSATYYVNDVLKQTTTLPIVDGATTYTIANNYVGFGGDQRNGYPFYNGVLVDNITIGKAVDTSFSVSSSPTVGAAVTLTGSVSPTKSAGTITFKDGSNNTLCTTATLSSGTASCTWTPLVQATYAVTAFYSGDSATLTQSSTSTASNIVVAQGTQSISFAAPADLDISATPPPLSATATSGLTVVFTSATASVCTVSGTSISLLTTGTCTINANQAGNSNYRAASQVQRSFNVSLRTQTITFGALADILISGTPPALSATASSGLAVAFTSATTGVCTVSNTTVTLLAPGTCTLNANQAGDGTFAAAPQVQQSFGVSYRSQTITFESLTGATLGVSSAPLIRGSASSGLGVNYSSTTPGVCSVSGTTISMLNPGTCTISASQAGNGTYSAAASVTQSFSITAKPDDGQKELMAILTLLPELASISKNIGDLAVNSMTKCVKGKLVKKVKKGAKCPKTYRKVTGS